VCDDRVYPTCLRMAVSDSDAAAAPVALARLFFKNATSSSSAAFCSLSVASDLRVCGECPTESIVM
jgi:hypothetical protein